MEEKFRKKIKNGLFFGQKVFQMSHPQPPQNNFCVGNSHKCGKTGQKMKNELLHCRFRHVLSGFNRKNAQIYGFFRGTKKMTHR